MNTTEFEQELNEDAINTMFELFTCFRNESGDDTNFVFDVERARDEGADFFKNKDCVEDSINYHADDITIYYSTVNSIFSNCYPYSQEIQDQVDEFGIMGGDFRIDGEVTFGEMINKIQSVAVYQYYLNKLREIVDSMIDDEERFYGILGDYILANQSVFTPEDYEDAILKRNTFIGSEKEEIKDIEERIDDDSKK